MKLSSYDEIDPNKKRVLPVGTQLGVMQRLYDSLPKKEDGQIDAYKLGRTFCKLYTEAQGLASAPDGDVMSYFVREKLKGVVENPKSMEQSFVAQFLLGSELLPKIFGSLNVNKES